MQNKFNVLLINPYIGFDTGDFYRTMSEPLGLLYLASHIMDKSDKYNIKILDLYALNPVKHRRSGIDNKFYFGLTEWETIKELLKDFSPEIIGITSEFTGYAYCSVEIAENIKKYMPNIPIIIGGAHATFFAENILKKYQFVDIIVRGEGEITFYELLEALRTKNGIINISGITYRSADNNIVSNNNRALITNLDDFTINDRTLIDMNKYLSISHHTFPGSANYPTATMVLSRGCKFNCIFCSTKNMWQNQWRARSYVSILNEIDYLINNFKVKEIAFVDDQILGDKKWFDGLLDFILSKKLTISFQIINGLSVWLIDENLLRKMRKAGFYKIGLPIDSGNQDTLKYINKQQISLFKIKKTIELVHRLGFFSSANFLIGFPNETINDIKKTVKFAYNCGVDIVYFFVAKMHTGSDMYNNCLNTKLLENIETGGSWANVSSNSQNISSVKLANILHDSQKYYFIYKCFFLLNPVNFYKHLFFKLTLAKNYLVVFKFFISAIIRIIYNKLQKYRK